MAKRKRETHKGISLKEVRERIEPIDEVSQKVTSLIYGRSGTGKTTVASTMVELPPVLDEQGDKILVVDMREEGTDSISDLGGQIDLFPVENWADFEGLYWYLKGSKHPYKGYVGDTVTQLQALAMRESKVRAAIDPEAAMTKRSWGFLSSMLGPYLLDFRSLPMHGCFTAQDRIDQAEIESEDDDDTLLPEVGPSVMPSVAVTLNGMVKVIGQTYIHRSTKRVKVKGKSRLKVRTVYRMRLGPHPYYLTKIRTPKSNRVPGSIPDPTFTKVVEIMRGEYGQETT